jgi:hypothetical protein
MLGSSGEDAPDGPACVATGVHLHHRSVGEMEPGDHDDVIAGAQAIERWPNIRVEHQPAVRRTLVALARGGGRFCHRRVDKTYRSEHEVRCHI